MSCQQPIIEGQFWITTKYLPFFDINIKRRVQVVRALPNARYLVAIERNCLAAGFMKHGEGWMIRVDYITLHEDQFVSLVALTDLTPRQRSYVETNKIMPKDEPRPTSDFTERFSQFINYLDFNQVAAVPSDIGKPAPDPVRLEPGKLFKRPEQTKPTRKKRKK